MAANYNEIVRIIDEGREFFTQPGVVKPGANIDIVRSGVPIFRQRSVTGEDGECLQVQMTRRVNPENPDPDVVVIYESPRSKT